MVCEERKWFGKIVYSNSPTEMDKGLLNNGMYVERIDTNWWAVPILLILFPLKIIVDVILRLTDYRR
jgi:hypothetical protein